MQQHESQNNYVECKNKTKNRLYTVRFHLYEVEEQTIPNHGDENQITGYFSRKKKKDSSEKEVQGSV